MLGVGIALLVWGALLAGGLVLISVNDPRRKNLWALISVLTAVVGFLGTFAVLGLVVPLASQRACESAITTILADRVMPNSSSEYASISISTAAWSSWTSRPSM